MAMKIALAQLNYHIGDLVANTTDIVLNIKKAQQFNVDLLIFSEMSVCGYPPQDMLDYPEFVKRCMESAENISRICTDIGVIIGSPTINEKKNGKNLHNSALFLHQGQIKSIHNKTLLPDYDIYDEYRYFEPSNEYNLIEFKGKKIAVAICEDLWFNQPVENSFGRNFLYSESPLDKLMKLEPDLVAGLVATPFAASRIEAKKEVYRKNAEKYGVPFFIVNQVGANNDLIFEGGSLVVNHKGEVFDRLVFFEEDFQIYELDEVTDTRAHGIKLNEKDLVDMTFQALVLGVKDYFFKLGFKKAVIGLSGGIDSAVTAVLAVRALGHRNVEALILPSRYTSEGSIEDALKLAKNLDIGYHVIEIDRLFDTFNGMLKPLFSGLPEDNTEENIQARIRSNILMAFSNKFGHILLNTSNKSESAVGYTTLYGDMSGSLSVIGDVYKTRVYEMAKYINHNKEIIPDGILSRAPSAELKENQKDSDDLPEYELLDKILFQYIELNRSAGEIKKTGADPSLVDKIISLVNKSEYKRYQSPPVLRVSEKAFGPGRKMPLVAKI